MSRSLINVSWHPVLDRVVVVAVDEKTFKKKKKTLKKERKETNKKIIIRADADADAEYYIIMYRVVFLNHRSRKGCLIVR